MKNYFYITGFLCLGMVGMVIGIACLLKNPQTSTDIFLVPPQIVNGFLEQGYSSAQKDLIKKDLEIIRDLSFCGKVAAQERPVYIASSGGPGACKSTILENFLQTKENFVYVDPDIRALKHMVYTYMQELTPYKVSQAQSYKDLLVHAYNVWRPASNYIANQLINEAYEKNFNIAHGTTLTSPSIELFFKKLQQKNYKIILLLCYASSETRIKIDEHRTQAQAFFQVDPQDIVTKGAFFPQRFPLYFKYADEIHFYWTQDLQAWTKYAAIYEKKKPFVVHDEQAWKAFLNQYDNDRKELDLISFQDIISMAA